MHSADSASVYELEDKDKNIDFVIGSTAPEKVSNGLKVPYCDIKKIDFLTVV